MRAFDRGDPVAGLIFSPDPVGRFMHEKVHGVQRTLAGDPALRALMFAVLEDAIACYQDYYRARFEQPKERTGTVEVKAGKAIP